MSPARAGWPECPQRQNGVAVSAQALGTADPPASRVVRVWVPRLICAGAGPTSWGTAGVATAGMIAARRGAGPGQRGQRERGPGAWSTTAAYVAG